MTETETVQHTGQIKWYDPVKGFGFIQVTGVDKDIFIHIKQLRLSGINGNLIDGEKVTFVCNTGPKGLYATNISRFNGGTNAPSIGSPTAVGVGEQK